MRVRNANSKKDSEWKVFHDTTNISPQVAQTASVAVSVVAPVPTYSTALKSEYLAPSPLIVTPKKIIDSAPTPKSSEP